MTTNRVLIGLGTIALLGVSGCLAAFDVYSPETGVTTPVRPIWGCDRIPVYWRNPEIFSPPKPSAPDRKFVVIGYIKGDACIWTNGLRYEFIDLQMQRGAAALHGDAVLNVHEGSHFYGPAPVIDFFGDVIMWQ